MVKTYQISNNIIFCVNEDGSINTYSLNGWGNSTRDHWNAGTYQIEVWYGNT